MRFGVNLELCADLSLAVYDSFDWKADNIEGLSFAAHGCTYLACRGTSKNKQRGSFALAEDVISNLRFMPRHNDVVGWAPGGFLEAGEAVANQASKIQIRTGKPLVLTGHSLGAAAAFIAAEILLADGYPLLGAVGFGSPRTGRMRRLSESDLGRSYTLGNDVVCEVPPLWRDPLPRRYKLKRTEGKGGLLKDHAMEDYLRFLGR